MAALAGPQPSMTPASKPNVSIRTYSEDLDNTNFDLAITRHELSCPFSDATTAIPLRPAYHELSVLPPPAQATEVNDPSRKRRFQAVVSNIGLGNNLYACFLGLYLGPAIVGLVRLASQAARGRQYSLMEAIAWFVISLMTLLIPINLWTLKRTRALRDVDTGRAIFAGTMTFYFGMLLSTCLACVWYFIYLSLPHAQWDPREVPLW